MFKINEIYKDDAIDFMKQIPDGSVDLVLTDPPYNISSKKKIFRDYRSGQRADISFDHGEWDYNFSPIPFLEQTKRVLNDDGSIIVFVSEQQHGIYRNWLEENMNMKQTLIWIKNNPLPEFRLVKYRQATEMIIWGSKNKIGKNNPNFIFGTQREMVNYFSYPICSGKERLKHPTQKPLRLVKDILKKHCKEGGLVVDPYAGTGTTGVACIELNRNYILCEKDEVYYNMAKTRLGL